MEKVRYMISDAATMAGVESHVLRYWEEELDLAIPRNEMGHRYYTRENISEFQKIKALKEQGYQLKAIRTILHKDGETPSPEPAASAEIAVAPPVSGTVAVADAAPAVKPVAVTHHVSKRTAQAIPAVPAKKEAIAPPAPALSAEERMDQFRELMSDIVGHAIAQNNEELSQNISQEVHETVLKEMNYLFREQEEAEEERFKKLDAALRGSVRGKRPLFGRSDKPKADKPAKPSRAERAAAKQKAKASLT